ncbi:transketolase C-terminal domain-containing protein [Candidatus Pelagibacter sp. Uisw_116]|uniref:alpha-ketoacid dehydrogenase subunit beta n=1 Tax=Candidatus Pelagibacter sp. Uisw_116 TaxID=3230986 RepID=UPI0039E95D3B
MPKKRIITFAEAVNEGLRFSLLKNKNLLCFGLGIGDPKEVFGTTKNLQKQFGDQRVFDIPTSENAMTGIAIGCAINRCPVVMTHQRLDFSLLSFDQIINNAAKIFYMFNGQFTVPITLRLIVGKGWGQGPTHAQSLQSLFAHIPGLKVVMPSNPNDAKKMLIQSIKDPNPVIYIEHRWLHDQKGHVEKGFKSKKIGKANLLMKGNDITIVANSFMTTEALIAAKILKTNGIYADLIDLCSIKPMDEKAILKSVKKTGKLLVLDSGHDFLSIASEIISVVTTKQFNSLKISPKKITMPNFPIPTGYSLTKNFYPGYKDVLKYCKNIFNKNIKYNESSNKNFHDVPHARFKGPF